jgi:GT2 family glycosyltransferase
MRQPGAPSRETPTDPGAAPTLSVIIPAYQASAFVADAVASALAQTVAPHEVIVCDDGSTDGLGAALAPHLDRITLVRRPHGGVAAARNSALEVASGEFVVMLDADDVYEPTRLEALGELAARLPDLDILATDLWLEEGGGSRARFYETVDFSVADQRLAILESCFVACPALRRMRVLEEGGFDESFEVAEDWDLFIRLILGGSRAGLVPEPLVRYRRHLSSTTADRTRSLRGRVRALEKACLHPTLTGSERTFLDRCLRRARARAGLSEAQTLAASGDRPARRSLVRLALAGGMPLTTRITAAAAAVAPRHGTRLLAWEERRMARSRPARPRSGESTA